MAQRTSVMARAGAVKPSLTIKRRFNAPPEKVFSAWTDAEKMKKWMGPGNIFARHVESDPRTGGRYRIIMVAPSGEEFDTSGVYREVIAGKKLVYTWGGTATPEQETLVTATFKPDGDGTLLTLLHEQFPDDASRDLHNGGWSGAIDKLGTYLGCKNEEDPVSQGTFIWNELVSNDVERAKTFYADAMGWTYDRFPMADGESYWIIKLGEQRIGGIYAFKAPENMKVPDFWLPYIAVDDVDASVKKAVAKGAKLMKPIFEVPNIGRMAMLSEPGGASVAWMTPSPK